jgi:hypothetical protein
MSNCLFEAAATDDDIFGSIEFMEANVDGMN